MPADGISSPENPQIVPVKSIGGKSEREPLLNREHTMKTANYQRSKASVYLVMLFLSLGYFGKYFCTSCIYIVQELFEKDTGVTKGQMSLMLSLGYLASMAGKIMAGIWSDSRGGKFTFMTSMTGYIASIVLFSFVPAGYSWSWYAFLACWFSNGFFALGLAWVAVVSVATNWIPTSMTATMMAVVSLAPQAGDVLARITLGQLLLQGYTWRAVLRYAGAIGFLLGLPVMLCVKDQPPTEEEGEENKDKVRTKEEEHAKQTPLCDRLAPILKAPMLWLICVVSGSLYGSRSLFLLYSTDLMLTSYCRGALAEGKFADMSECRHDRSANGVVASCSMVYTLLGCVSVMAVGILKDQLPKHLRALILVCFIAPLLGTMLAFDVIEDPSFDVTVTLVGIIGLSLFGPYKVLGAAFSVDIGGKKLKATACSIMGLFDNFFAMALIMAKGHLEGWDDMFKICTALSLSAFLCACAVFAMDLKKKAAPKAVDDDADSPRAIRQASTALQKRKSFKELSRQQ